MTKGRRIPVLWIIGLALLGGAGWAGYRWWPRSSDGFTFQTVAAKRTDITNAVTATGTLSAVVSVQVGSQISGNIKTLLADFNTPVKAGQVVAQLDPATFEAVVNQAQGELANARAALELAQFDAVRQRELSRNKLSPQADLDKALAELHQAEAAVQIKEATLSKAKIDLARCTIAAPVDGIVISRNVDVGQTVAAAMTAPVLFTIAGDLTKMHIEANVSEADIGGIGEGLETTFTVDAFPDRTFHGQVVQVRYAPVTVDNVVTYVTVIEVSNPKLELRPGMTANVSIVLAERKGAIAVPNAALRFKPPQAAGGDGAKRGGGGGPRGAGAAAGGERKRTIYRLEGGEPKPFEVALGITDAVFTEVLSGVNEGELVVTGAVSSKPAVAAPAASPFGGASPGGGPPGGGSIRRGGGP